MVRHTRARAERGQILILTALSMTLLLGMAAFSVDASFMYDKRNKLYAAADAGAKLGATEVNRNASVTQAALEAFASEQAIRHGLTPGACGSTTPGVAAICVNHPPSALSIPFVGKPGYVEVIISETTNTFFGKIIGILSAVPGARAVAGMGPGANCIVTLGPPGSTPASLNIGSSSNISMGCNIADGGDLVVDSSGYITGGSTEATGTCSGTGGGCGHVSNLSTSVPAPSDPLAGVFPVPTNPGGCTPLVLTSDTTIGPGCYSSIRMDATGMTLTMSPGNYYLTGPFTTANQPTITGTGVFIYLDGTAPTGPCLQTSTAGCFNIDNNATVTLSAPTSGTYTAMLIWQASTDQLNASFTGNNPTYDMSGAMYFPNADVAFRNGLSGTNDCTLFVARTLSIDHGNGGFSNTCSAYGGSPILVVSVAE